MKKSIVPLAIVFWVVLSAQWVSAANCGSSSTVWASSTSTASTAIKTTYQPLSMSAARQALVELGYIQKHSSRQQIWAGIMKFQADQNLKKTGAIGPQTQKAIEEVQKLPTIAEAAVGTPTLSTLVTAVKAGGLVETLSSTGPFTVFAPTNDAFGKVPPDTLKALLTPEKKSDLVNILTYHVVSSMAFSKDLKNGQEITTVQGKKLKVSIKDGKVFINNAQVIMADIKTKNGVVHVIDSVLLP